MSTASSAKNLQRTLVQQRRRALASLRTDPAFRRASARVQALIIELLSLDAEVKEAHRPAEEANP